MISLHPCLAGLRTVLVAAPDGVIDAKCAAHRDVGDMAVGLNWDQITRLEAS